RTVEPSRGYGHGRRFESPSSNAAIGPVVERMPVTTNVSRLALTTLLVSFLATSAFGAVIYTTIDHPQAGPGGTTPYSIDGGRIVGSYLDASGATHGFLYDGTTWTTLDDPLAAAPRGK